MREKLVKRIIDIDYHRNGIFGQSFCPVIFESTDGKRMVAVVLPKESDQSIGSIGCFVLDIDKLADGNVAFGENSWRGDQYADELRAAIEAWHNEERTPA